MVASGAARLSDSIYHERQVRDFCAMHALNNIFQRKEFTKQELDKICVNLSPDFWINPHKSILGWGNYDINVIMAALQRKGCEAVWFDKRRDLGDLLLKNIKGFILNIPSDWKLGFVPLPLGRRHWIALRSINDDFYNLDSKLDSPQIIGQEDDFLAYLKEQIESKDKELFLIVLKEIESTQGWLRESVNDTSAHTNELEKNRTESVPVLQNVENSANDSNGRSCESESVNQTFR
ncbi:hypothetical protein QAD02_015670 [Eretmocerus hayati]|uniref:Uncharacterized protein n=1 Tax=Eretmocerus hayati TaxID=131215 RepID=A0ACC2P8Z0_9HYME|nr:hypothetical protein QAD02_015670 [Eretmocerus hayati]